MPWPRVAMMSRWISAAPPAIVLLMVWKFFADEPVCLFVEA